MQIVIIIVNALFLSTLSLRRATGIIDIINNVIDDFYPRSPCGERQHIVGTSQVFQNFYPRSPCGERPTKSDQGASNQPISIHALLAESDNLPSSPMERNEYFYPRSPCGERRGYGQYYIRAREISIHALLAESDRSADCNYRNVRPISIHALLAESDIINPASQTNLPDFYPRSPCGERPVMDNIIFVPGKFLSTLSLRRATAKVHKTVGHFCAYGTNFMGIASSC